MNPNGLNALFPTSNATGIQPEPCLAALAQRPKQPDTQAKMSQHPSRNGRTRALAVLCTALIAGVVALGVSMATASAGSSQESASAAAAKQAAIVAKRTRARQAAQLRAKARTDAALAKQEAAAKAQQARVSAFNLEPGDQGTRVGALQERLIELKMLRRDQADGNYNDATVAAVMAFQKSADLDRDGISGPKTLDAVNGATVKEPTPFTKQKADHVEISISKQLAQIVKGGKVIRVISISSGKDGLDTPTGTFAVYSKNSHAYSKIYHSPMPMASFFSGDFAMHQSDSVPGYRASHGCVRIPAAFANELYAFTTIGMPVVVLA